MPTPEALARQNIDAQLAACGWIVQDRGAINLFAGRGVAVREHHRRSIRLQGYDYTQAGAYFITLVTAGRECLFGEIVDGAVRLRPAGKAVAAEWQRMQAEFPHIHFDACVVMPNHFHGIIVIDAPAEGIPCRGDPSLPEMDMTGEGRWPETARAGQDGSPLQAAPEATPGYPNGPPPGSLGTMVGQFKSRATKRIWGLPVMGKRPIWQRNYYENIVRSQADFDRICEYIQSNPERWQADQLHPAAPSNSITQG